MSEPELGGGGRLAGAEGVGARGGRKKDLEVSGDSDLDLWGRE